MSLNDFLDFKKMVNRYYGEGFPQEYKDECLLRIRQHLHHTSKFTEFKRWAIRDRIELYEDLKIYFI